MGPTAGRQCCLGATFWYGNLAYCSWPSTNTAHAALCTWGLARFQLAALQREMATLKAENERLCLVRTTAAPACCITPLACCISLLHLPRSDTIDHFLSDDVPAELSNAVPPTKREFGQVLVGERRRAAGHPVAANAPRTGDRASGGVLAPCRLCCVCLCVCLYGCMYDTDARVCVRAHTSVISNARNVG